MWRSDPKHAAYICKTLEIPYKPNLIFEGAVVKSNGPADRTVRTYIRNERTGLLEDYTASVRARGLPRDELEDALVREIGVAAAGGWPYTTSGKAGLWERRAEMEKHFHMVSRDRMRAIAQRLKEADRIVECNPVNRAGALDVPDGPVAQGLQGIERTARPVRAEDA